MQLVRVNSFLARQVKVLGRCAMNPRAWSHKPSPTPVSLRVSDEMRAATAAYVMAIALAPDADTYRRDAGTRFNVMTGY